MSKRIIGNWRSVDGNIHIDFSCNRKDSILSWYWCESEDLDQEEQIACYDSVLEEVYNLADALHVRLTDGADADEIDGWRTVAIGPLFE